MVTGHGTDHRSHEIALGREPRYFTVFRDPAPLMVSRYNFFLARQQTEVPFEEWYPTLKPNWAHRRMRLMMGASNYPDLQQKLRDFWFVGITEHLNEDLPHIFGEMGLPTEWKNRRVAGAGVDMSDVDTKTLPGERFAVERKLTLTDEIRERVEADNQKDVRLYEFAKELRQEMIERHGWS